MSSKYFCICFCFFIIMACSTKLQEQYDLIIAHANVIDGTGNPLIKNQKVYVKNGRIERIDQ